MPEFRLDKFRRLAERRAERRVASVAPTPAVSAGEGSPDTHVVQILAKAESSPEPTQLSLEIEVGKLTAITGPNGVGKSALLDEIAISLGIRGEKFAGHRQIYFPNDDIDQIGWSLDEFQRMLRQSPENINRFRHAWGEQHLKSVLKRAMNTNAQAALDVIGEARAGSTIEQAIVAHPLLLDRVNSVFSAARMPVSFMLENGTLRAQRGGVSYPIHRLSDGERAALLLVCAVLIQPPNGFILVDEPEKHLDPRISGPLISAAIRSRPDIGFVMSTHDLTLLEWMAPKEILHVKDSMPLSQTGPEQRTYDLHVLPPDGGVDDDLRTAILGARQNLLLVEGDTSSEDRSVYSLVYESWNVAPRGGWDTVANDVRSLRKNETFHWVNVAGIVDGDGRNAVERDELQKDNIFALPSPAIENILLREAIIRAMAEAAHALQGGSDPDLRVERARRIALELTTDSRDEIVARRVAWEANRELAARKVSVKDIRDGKLSIDSVDLTAIRDREAARFDEVMAAGDAATLVSALPIKNSKVPAAVAKALGFSSFADYKRAVLKQMEDGTPAGAIILNDLRSALPTLPTSGQSSPSNMDTKSAHT